MIGILKHNFDLLLTHYDNPEMSPYNNVLEGFNDLIKRRTRLMKGFKKPLNISRWLKLLLTESEVTAKRNRSPLQLSSCQLPNLPNWITWVRVQYRIIN